MTKTGDQVLLLDFYGGLLSSRQLDILDLHWNEDYSLAEIAENFGISRQAVHDAVKNGCSLMDRFEERLGLVRHFKIREEKLLLIRSLAEQLLDGCKPVVDLPQKECMTSAILSSDGIAVQEVLKQILAVTEELIERDL